MELVIPPSLSLTIGSIIAFLTIFASIIGVYFRLAASLATLEEKFVKMEQRNYRADEETEAVKIEQAQQKTAVAVMAEQISSQYRMIERIDRNIEELMKRGGK